MGEINPLDFIDLGATAVVALAAFWAVVQIDKAKKANGNGNGTNKAILQQLQTMNDNHLHSMEECIRDGNKQLIETIHNDNIKIIELLGRIDGRLDR